MRVRTIRLSRYALGPCRAAGRRAPIQTMMVPSHHFKKSGTPSRIGSCRVLELPDSPVQASSVPGAVASM
jgi:hypothetical protein